MALSEDHEGSFWFPPRTTTAAEVIEFWSQVAIPDIVLKRAERAQRAAHDEYTEETARVSWAEEEERWLAANPKPPAKKIGKNTELQQWTADYEEHKAACHKQYPELVREKHPHTLPLHDVRPIVRAAVMRVEGQELDESEFTRICNHELELSDGSRRTVGELTTTYLLGYKAGQFMAMRNADDPALTPDSMPAGELRQELDAIQNQIEDVGKFLAEVQRIEGMSGTRAGRKQIKRDYG